MLEIAHLPETTSLLLELRDTSLGLIKTGRITFSKCLSYVRKIGLADETSYVSGTKPDSFSPRIKADLSTRRLRLEDVAEEEDSDILGWLTHFDVITATNVLIWTKVWGKEIFMKCKWLGMFNSIEGFVTMGSDLSSYVKRFPLDDGCKQAFAEINVLSGYMQNDIKETDWEEEFEKLAHGGAEHGLIGEDILSTMRDQMSLYMSKPATGRFMTFKEYIESGEWATSGSSSIGKIEWSTTGERGKFKARKNMLEYLYTSEELWKIASNWDGKLVSKVFTKDELSKRRLAVASNIESYLHESYALRLLGHSYLGWPMITLDESPKKAHERSSGICLELGRDRWALPFDFKAFDHQATTDEVVLMLENNLNTITVPNEYKKSWTVVKHKILKSYRMNTLIMQTGKQKFKAQMTGGLPSGVRVTSLIGNQWNALMTLRAKEIAKQLLRYDPEYTIGIRGDDTYILANKAAELLVFRYAYMSINAVGLDSKFGISQKVCEFLRNEITAKGMRGWSNRSIPTMTQRKPWTSDPWSLTAPTETTAGNIRNFERRLGFEVEWLHRSNMEKWKRYTKQSAKWLELPKIAGGVGCYPWHGYTPTSTIPKISTQGISVDNKLAPRKPEWSIELNEEQQQHYSEEKLKSTFVSDDVSAVTSHARTDVLMEFRKTKTSWVKERIDWRISDHVPTRAPPINNSVYWPHRKYPLEAETISLAMKIISDYPAIRKLIDSTLGQLLEKHVPAFYGLMKEYESRGWHRTNAINLCVGSENTAIQNGMHPILTPFVEEAVRDAGSRFWRGRKNIAVRTYQSSRSASEQIIQSPGYLLYEY